MIPDYVSGLRVAAMALLPGITGLAAGGTAAVAARAGWMGAWALAVCTAAVVGLIWARGGKGIGTVYRWRDLASTLALTLSSIAGFASGLAMGAGVFTATGVMVMAGSAAIAIVIARGPRYASGGLHA